MSQGFRIFSDNDVQIFERIKEMSNDTGMPVDRIASMLVSEQKNDASDPIRIESEVATPLENELKMIDESDIGRIDRQYEALLKETQKQEKVTLETAATTEDKTTEDKRTKNRDGCREFLENRPCRDSKISSTIETT